MTDGSRRRPGAVPGGSTCRPNRSSCSSSSPSRSTSPPSRRRADGRSAPAGAARRAERRVRRAAERRPIGPADSCSGRTALLERHVRPGRPGRRLGVHPGGHDHRRGKRAVAGDPGLDLRPDGPRGGSSCSSSTTSSRTAPGRGPPDRRGLGRDHLRDPAHRPDRRSGQPVLLRLRPDRRRRRPRPDPAADPGRHGRRGRRLPRRRAGRPDPPAPRGRPAGRRGGQHRGARAADLPRHGHRPGAAPVARRGDPAVARSIR